MVRPAKGAILGYKPEPPPTDIPASAQRYLDQELHRVAGVLQGVLAQMVTQEATLAMLREVVRSENSLLLSPMSVEPVDPPMGLIVCASGPDGWDPGSGSGIYYFNGVTWSPLG